MAPEDTRAAIEAAIERTERAEVPVGVAFRSRHRFRATISWETDDVLYACYRCEDPASDVLLVDGAECPTAYELDGEELRANLETAGVLDAADVTVYCNDDYWFELADLRMTDESRRAEARAALAEDPPFEYLGECDRPGVRAVVEECRRMYVNGTAIAGEFALTDDAHARELFADRGLERGRGHVCLGDLFLRSPAVAEFLETASPQHHDEVPGFDGGHVVDDAFSNLGDVPANGRFERVSPTGLAGRVTGMLAAGGAYEDFAGDDEEATMLGLAFSHAMRDGKWRDRDGKWFRRIDAYVGNVRWTQWFAGTILYCDTTIVVVDREAERVRLFVGTDTD